MSFTYRHMNGVFADNRGVSGVIGVVLLIAITVILASMTAVFVISFDEQTGDVSPRVVPETTFDDSYSGNGQTLIIKHQQGDQINTETISIRVQDAKTHPGGSDVSYTGDVFSNQLSGTFGMNDQITLDQRHFNTGGQDLDLSDATVRIVWESPDTDQSDTIYLCEVEGTGCKKTS